jgi:hypothetical protein
MTIDWQTFAARVPAGTRVLGEGGEGILLENYPYIETEYEGHELSEWLRVQPFTPCYGSGLHYWLREVQALEYLIDGTWVSYAQLMTGEM